MENEDKVGGSFLAAKDTEYVARLEEMLLVVNKLITELIAAQGGTNSISQALDSYLKTSGLVGDLDAGGHRVTNSANATAGTDLVTLQQLTALVSAGTSDPGLIAVTALGLGVLSNGEVLGAVDGALTGVDISNLVTATTLAQQVALINQKNTELQEKVEEVEGLAIIGI